MVEIQVDHLNDGCAFGTSMNPNRAEKKKRITRIFSDLYSSITARV